MATVTEAITAEIDRLRVGDLAPGLAQLAVSLAGSVDEPGGPTAKANAARELRAVMSHLADTWRDEDRLDEIRASMHARRNNILGVPKANEWCDEDPPNRPAA